MYQFVNEALEIRKSCYVSIYLAVQRPFSIDHSYFSNGILSFTNEPSVFDSKFAKCDFSLMKDFALDCILAMHRLIIEIRVNCIDRFLPVRVHVCVL